MESLYTACSFSEVWEGAWRWLGVPSRLVCVLMLWRLDTTYFLCSIPARSDYLQGKLSLRMQGYWVIGSAA